MKDTEQTFHPDPGMKKLYYTYLSVPFCLFIAFGVLPLLYFLGASQIFLWIILPFVILPVLVLFGVIALWIPKFYASLSYKLTEHSLFIKQGVWFKKKKSIPYAQITDAIVSQGPIIRRFDLANIDVQTAGRSGQMGSEATLRSIKNYDAIGENLSIRAEKTKTTKPVDMEEAMPKTEDGAILKELRAIRELLQQLVEE